VVFNPRRHGIIDQPSIPKGLALSPYIIALIPDIPTLIIADKLVCALIHGRVLLEA
jgi:hypothetical protein